VDLSVLLLIVSGAAFVALVVLGTYLWWPTRHKLASRSEVGSALMTGAVVALAIFLLEVGAQERTSDIEEQRADEQAVQTLKLQVAVQDELYGFDFRQVLESGREDAFSGFSFGSKLLEEADFRGLTLTGANFIGAKLVRAKLQGANLGGADLIGANLDGAKLNDSVLAHADLTAACLRDTELMEANLTGAELGGADLSGARFDADTVWPDGRKRKCLPVSCPVRRPPPTQTTCDA
jgi:uncharacterized protein YjbI with pentapeptide repeats